MEQVPDTGRCDGHCGTPAGRCDLHAAGGIEWCSHCGRHTDYWVWAPGAFEQPLPPTNEVGGGQGDVSIGGRSNA
ncbi:MAG: hypothetical protein QM642_09390 [Edaphocola sp.]